MELFYFLGGIILIWKLLCIVLDTMHPCFHNFDHYKASQHAPNEDIKCYIFKLFMSNKEFLVYQVREFFFFNFHFFICTYFNCFIFIYLFIWFNVNILCSEYLNTHKLEVRKKIKIVFPKVDYLHHTCFKCTTFNCAKNTNPWKNNFSIIFIVKSWDGNLMM